MKKIFLLLFICSTGSLSAMYPHAESAAPNGHAFYALAQWLQDKLSSEQASKPAAARTQSKRPKSKRPRSTRDARVLTFVDKKRVMVVVPPGHTVTVVTSDSLTQGGYKSFPPIDDDSDN